MSIVKDLLLLFIFLAVEFIFFLINDSSIFAANFVFLNSCVIFCFVKYVYLKNKLVQQREYFIKTLNHDLRVSTLAQIRGLELLQKSSGLAMVEQIELINNINDSCKYTLDMISMLLKTYQFENGEKVLNLEPTNLEDLIFESFKTNMCIAEEKNIKFYYNSAENVQVDVDKSLFLKLLKTLLLTSVFNSNLNSKINVAVKYLDNKMKISVMYKGKPLSEEEQKRMFSKSPRFSTVGHGIKMYLCKKIVEFHGGKIWINNDVEDIYSFVFTIPNLKKNLQRKSVLAKRSVATANLVKQI